MATASTFLYNSLGTTPENYAGSWPAMYYTTSIRGYMVGLQLMLESHWAAQTVEINYILKPFPYIPHWDPTIKKAIISQPS